MENLKIKIENEYKMYVKSFMMNACLQHKYIVNLFEERAGYDMAIVKAFKDYFDDMLHDDKDVIVKTVKNAAKVEMNLFDFVVESYWAFDDPFNFMEYKECKEFLEGLK